MCGHHLLHNLNTASFLQWKVVSSGQRVITSYGGIRERPLSDPFGGRKTIAGVLPDALASQQSDGSSSRRSSFAQPRGILKDSARTLDFDSFNTLASLPSQEGSKSRRVSFASRAAVRLFNTESRLEKRELRTAPVHTDISKSPRESSDEPSRRASVSGGRPSPMGTSTSFSSYEPRPAASSSSSTSQITSPSNMSDVKGKAVNSVLSALRSSSYPENRDGPHPSISNNAHPSDPLPDSDSSFYVSDVDTEERLAGENSSGSHDGQPPEGSSHQSRPYSQSTNALRSGTTSPALSVNNSLSPEDDSYAKRCFDLMDITGSLSEDERDDPLNLYHEERRFKGKAPISPHRHLEVDRQDTIASDKKLDSRAIVKKDFIRGQDRPHSLPHSPSVPFNISKDTFSRRHALDSLSPLRLPSETSMNVTGFRDSMGGIQDDNPNDRKSTDRGNTTAKIHKLISEGAVDDDSTRIVKDKETNEMTQELKEMNTFTLLSQYQEDMHGSTATDGTRGVGNTRRESDNPLSFDEESESDWMEETLPIGRIRSRTTGRLSGTRRSWMDTTGSVDGDDNEEMEETEMFGGLKSFRLPSSFRLDVSKKDEDMDGSPEPLKLSELGENASEAPKLSNLREDGNFDESIIDSPKLLSPSQLLPDSPSQPDGTERRHTLLGSIPSMPIGSSTALLSPSSRSRLSERIIPMPHRPIHTVFERSASSGRIVEVGNEEALDEKISSIPEQDREQERSPEGMVRERKRRNFPLYAHSTVKSPRSRMSGSPGRAMLDNCVSPTPDPPYSVSISSSPNTPSVSQEMLVATSRLASIPRPPLSGSLERRDSHTGEVGTPVGTPKRPGPGSLLRTPPRRKPLGDDRVRTPLHMQSAARIA
ncbi:hypothetical protein BJ684DRAFT_17577, partial [Piptocephalis cylindrospora]